jgi:hypothetical protein
VEQMEMQTCLRKFGGKTVKELEGGQERDEAECSGIL